MIPEPLRRLALNELHVKHIGIVKTKLLAPSFIYCMNNDRDIKDKVNSCRASRLVQKEPTKVEIHHWETPTEPWKRVHYDFAGPIHGQ